MESDSTVLILLFLTVTVSGCLHSSGTETVTEGPESVTVQSLQVNPSEIYEDQNVRASITAFNSGNVPAEVLVGKYGDRILTNYCPDIFENREDRFTASSSKISDTRTGERASYELDPGEKINVRWFLQQTGNVPIIGKRCEMSFSVPFNYSVDAYRQVQIKQNREVEGSPSLRSESSSGPLVLALETLPGTTGQPDTFIAEETGDQNIQLLIQLINRQPEEEEFRKGITNIYPNTFYISATEPLNLNERANGVGDWSVQGDYTEPKCEMPDADFRLFEGRSVTIQCEIPVPQNFEQPSVLSEITAGVNYTYIKDAGERTVRVETRG